MFLSACVEIGAKLTSFDFESRANGQRLVRRRGGFTEEMSFQSSYSNVAGEWVAIWPAAMVRVPKLKKWRESSETPSRHDDVLAAGRVENIAEVKFGTWNLADPRTRPAVVSSVVDALKSTVLAWFDLIEDDEVLAVLQERDIPCFDIEWVAEYAVFLGRPDLATSIVRAWLERRGDAESPGFIARLQPMVDRYGLDVDLPKPRFRIGVDADRLRNLAG